MIKVAIKCYAYNHEAYIRDCLDGFVMQQTNFLFVAVVHDDASTDGTAAIIQEYAEKYPDIIKPIYEKENQYNKHDGSLQRIVEDACTATGAKYIAICEGDDYWIDPLKLQKQVDFLESHKEYDMVCGRFKHRVHELEMVIDSDLYDNAIPVFARGMEINQEHFIHAILPQPCTVMYRQGTMYDNDLIGKLKYTFDYPLFWCFMNKHRVWLINEKMAMYRKHEGSLTTRSEYGKSVTFYEMYRELYQYDANPILRDLLFQRVKGHLSQYIKYNRHVELKRICSAFLEFLSMHPSLKDIFEYLKRFVRAVGFRLFKGEQCRQDCVRF